MNPSDMDLAIHPIGKMTALIAQLNEEGMSAGDALAGTGLDPHALTAPHARLSYRQLLRIMRNALAQSSDPSLALRAGQRVHVTSYGLYGYALLSSTTVREAFDFAVRYHRMATPLSHIGYEQHGSAVLWRIESIFELAADDPLYRFLIEFQLGVHLALHRDVLGTQFTPKTLALVYDRPAHAGAYRRLFDCPVSFNAPSNEMHLDARWLAHAPTFGNAATHAATRALCDEALGAIESDDSVRNRVSVLLRRCPGRFPSAEEVASSLHMTVRTLHRKLSLQGTTFQKLRDELRYTLAMRYLRETDITISDIADRLAYSDAAAFRQAFRRWTGDSPSQIRAPAA